MISTSLMLWLGLLKWIATGRVFLFLQRKHGWQSADTIWYLSPLHIVYHIFYMRLHIYNIACVTLGFSSDCVGETSAVAFHLLSRFEIQTGFASRVVTFRAPLWWFLISDVKVTVGATRREPSPNQYTMYMYHRCYGGDGKQLKGVQRWLRVTCRRSVK